METKGDELLPRAGKVEGRWGVTANRYGVSFEGNENVPKLTVVIVVHL